MASQPEVDTAYPSGVYQLEITDPVIGGVGGVSNKPHLDQASRTGFLRACLNAVISGAGLTPDNGNNLQFWTALQDIFATLLSPTFVGVPKAPTAAPGTSNAQIASTAFVQVASAVNMQVFTSNGTFVVPSGVTQVDVEVIAGGGAGGTANSSVPGGGGGAGGRARAIVSGLTPGAGISVVVGAGGAVNASPGYGWIGGNSQFGGYMSATGGNGGQGNSTNAAGGAPGLGMLFSGASGVGEYGSYGTDGINSASKGGDGGGPGNGRGVTGGGLAGLAGTAPGGGGGGGSPGGAGGAGAPGKVTVWW